MAHELTFASGAAEAITISTIRPFTWSDCYVHLPSGTANEVDAVKGFTWSINNNLEVPHYLTGSRQAGTPTPLNRDYEVTLTLDATSTWTKPLYDQYFQGGSKFNLMLSIVGSRTGESVGSRDMFIVMSGCTITDMEAPSASEGLNEQTITIQPQNSIVEVNDTIFIYNAWE